MTKTDFPRIISLLKRSTAGNPPFPPTILYNEGWLLRLVLDWYSNEKDLNITSPLRFATEATWFSEALLPSAFLAENRADKHAESWTHADGVIGHFKTDTGKAGLTLNPDATQLIVTEAKIYSKLSPGVKNAPDFDQAARNVACIAKILHASGRDPAQMELLGFYVLAPCKQIEEKGLFDNQLQKESIKLKVELRIAEYAGREKYDELTSWFERWFLPLLNNIKIKAISWEALLEPIAQMDEESYREISSFYEKCKEYNQTKKVKADI